MNKKATLFLMLLVFAFGAAQAAKVTEDQVKLAAKGWVARGGTLGAAFGRTVDSVSKHATENGALFYAVKMFGGGTVFMSSDTDYTPVIAFTASQGDFSQIDRKSPLWALLSRDVSKMKDASVAARSATGNNTEQALKMAELAKSGSKLWQDLIEQGKIDTDKSLKFEDPITSGNPGDLRVGPLMKSKWSQSDVNGKACWNYYTPNGSDPSKFVAGDSNNIVCGCVATAMAQIMRYHAYPTQEIAPLTRECFWGKTAMRLTTQGGFYDWDKMTYVPSGKADMADENYQAIGKLASDAGISVYMGYNSDGGGGASGAFSFDISGAMINYWEYGNAVFLSLSSSDNIEEKDLDKISRAAMYSNFDAGLPVFVGIPGHQIVADGYGWNNEVEYVHLNMGWAGLDDFWYNLPNIPDFDAVNDLVYNVMPYADANSVVVSGRTIDDEGKAIAKATVELYSADTLVTQLVSSATGVWGAIVPAGTYEVNAYSQDGAQTLIGEIENVVVAKPNTVDVTWNSLRKVPTVRSSDKTGNSWGNDITLSNPSVRVGSEIFSTLDKALAAAKENSIELVEILAPTELRRDTAIDFNCTITTLEDGLEETPVTWRDGVVLTVADGGSLTLSNLVITATGATPIDVAAGGALTVSGALKFDVDYKIAAVNIADNDAFTVVGALKYGFALNCESALEIGLNFGKLVGLSAEDAPLTAEKIANFNDDTGEIRGVIAGDASPFVLKWDERQVPVEECTGYYVDSNFVTNTSARIERLFIKFENDNAQGKLPENAEVVIRKSGSLSREITVGSNIAIRGENDAVVDALGSASFVVTNGTLTVQGLGFNGYKGNCLFLVNGGELVLSNGVSIAGMIGTNYYSGAVTILSGTATLGPDIEITNCRFESLLGGSGAGVYVNSMATLNFFGGRITDCEAIGDAGGGGIYVNRKAVLNLKGDIFISGNRKYASGSYVPNNVVAFGSSSTVNVIGPVSGTIGIAYGPTAGSYNMENGAFAKVAAGLSDKEKAGIGRNAAAFVNDINSSLNATFSSDQQNLIRTGDSVAAGTVPDNLIDFAYARVVEPSGETVYYWSLSDAFAAVDTDGSSVEMLRSDNFEDELLVANNDVRLVSALDGGVASLTGGTFRVSGSLALTNVLISGDNLFNVDGGLLFIDGAVSSAVGCVGGSQADPNLFAMVRGELSYESLTNSAANFRNGELDAYGVAVTNAAKGTALVWSRSIKADGSYEGADGETWGCVGDIPVYEVEVQPSAIAFSSIVRDDVAGVWNLTLTNLVRGCWYSLYATNSLSGGFVVGEGAAQAVTNFQAEADGEFIFKVEADGASMFWKAVAEPGVIAE